MYNNKILLLTDNFLPHFGGSRIMLFNICNHIPRGKICVLTKYTNDSKDFDTRQKFRIYRVPLFKFPRKVFWIFYEFPTYLFLLFGALFIIVKERVKIIFVGEALPCGLIAFLLKKILGVPYLVFTFAEDITTISELKKEREVQHLILRNADFVIATCSFIENFLKDNVKLMPQRITKILPAIEEEIINFQSDERRLHQIIDEMKLRYKKVIFTCARLIERKGIDNVIKALPEVIKIIPNVIYLIGGEGPYRKTLEGLMNKNRLRDYVKFLGELQRRELPYFYILCDIFIMPSRQLNTGDAEGFGIVFLEANAFGKSVIGPNIAGPRDAIVNGVTGLQVDPYNINDIAQAITILLSNEDYAKRLGEEGRQRVKREFRWQDRSEQIYRLSEEIIKYAT